MTVAADVQAVCEACSEVFHPRQYGQRFCSRPCVDASRRVPAPASGSSAMHRRARTARSSASCTPTRTCGRRAAEVAQRRRKAWLPQPEAPTEAQVSCYLSNRDRPDTLAQRAMAVAELAELETGRLVHLGSLSNHVAKVTS